MASKIEIIKRAASRTGNGSIVSIDDNAEIARLTEEHYEAIVEECLTQHGWKFARKVAACQLTDVTPELPWSQMWRKPTGLLSLQYVQDDQAQRIDHEERDHEQGACVVVTCSQTALLAVGTYRVAEARWPGDFAMAIQHRMEGVFYGGIAEQHDLAAERDKMAEMKLQRARVRDQRASTPTDASEWNLVAARGRRAAQPRGGR